MFSLSTTQQVLNTVESKSLDLKPRMWTAYRSQKCTSDHLTMIVSQRKLSLPDLSAPLPCLTSLSSAAFETCAVTLVEVPAEV